PLAGHQVLCHIEAEAAQAPERAGVFALICRLDSMRAVFNHIETMVLGNGTNCAHVACPAGKMHWNDGSRPSGYACLDLAWINVPGDRIHVRKDRRRTGMYD